MEEAIEYRCPSCGETAHTVIDGAVIRCRCGAGMMRITPVKDNGQERLNMALCSLGKNGKPEYYYYYKHSKTDRQELSNQSHRKMRNYNKELIRQELDDYMNEAV